MSRWPKRLASTASAQRRAPGCARLIRSAAASASAGIASSRARKACASPRPPFARRQADVVDAVVIVAHAERRRLHRVLAQQPGIMVVGERLPIVSRRGECRRRQVARRRGRKISLRIAVSLFSVRHPIRELAGASRAMATSAGARRFVDRFHDRNRQRHDRRRSHAGARRRRPRRPRLPRPSQGPRLSRLHRGVGALLLLRHAGAARPLHGQVSAAARAMSSNVAFFEQLPRASTAASTASRSPRPSSAPMPPPSI